MVTRIREEFEYIRQSGNSGITLNLDKNNLFCWNLMICGPEDSPYAGGLFDIRVEFTESYPNQPPAFYFLTPIYHVNIASNGAVCHTVLDSKYDPSISVYHIILYIISMMRNPEPASYMADRAELANLYNSNRERYLENAREHTRNHAF